MDAASVAVAAALEASVVREMSVAMEDAVTAAERIEAVTLAAS